ncbi:hypothetical protein SLEP1_g44747 [Rubroshorea leprosula]|uniref:Uncharacterized protein n=1 Tax=Rubroshorea leprosula TaxID=152421 RepID=A0AAV5LH35_9ROSI|nr:hypothetical protein SLEP1_g44747 [Rubroshorea leprosula]
MEQNLYHSGEQTCKNCERVLAVALLMVVCNIWCKGYVSIREDGGVGDDEIDVADLEEQMEVLIRQRKSGEEKFEERDVEGMPLARTEEGGRVSFIVEERRNSSTGKEETALLTDETEVTEGNGQGDIAYSVNAFHDNMGFLLTDYFMGTLLCMNLNKLIGKN